ncbi:MAG TPA: CPXCG motif-containing cysteine-rich protein [Longimicrobium sp.]|nr:CPXCG motif-containing cysteine-rich protein [Longimicrobium sp.]
MGYGLHPDAFMDDADPELDADFPLGDGTADCDATVDCPYCGEAVEITLDPGSGTRQEYVEDCEVCCRPWQVSVAYAADGSAAVNVVAADDPD